MAIRNKEYLRKRLLKRKKNKPTNVLSERIKMLDSKIKIYYHGLRRKKVRKDILPGNTKSLWNAVKIAKEHSIDR